MEPLHRLFCAAQGRLRSAGDEGIFAAAPDAKVALDQLQYAVPWFDTYNTVAVRKAMEDQVQAILSGKTTPADAVQTAQKNADELLRALCRTDRAETAGVTRTVCASASQELRGAGGKPRESQPPRSR